MNLSYSSAYALTRRNLVKTRHGLARAASTSPCTQYSEPTHIAAAVPDPATQEALERSVKYILGVYARPDFVLSRGKGSWLFDSQGRKFLDLSAGIAVNALGHSDAGLTQVLTEQSQKLVHASNVYHNEWAGKLAELLVNKTKQCGGLGFRPRGPESSLEGDEAGAKVFFANSGAEANEGALKIAKKNARERSATKEGIVHLENSFHGRTMGALSVTGTRKYKEPFGHLLSNISSMTMNDKEALLTCINDDTAAVIVEPIQGEGGVNAATTEWLIALRQRCDEKGAILIYDEIQCGLFRTGTMWAHSTLPVECHPDIVTMAKPLANGFPIGAVLMKDSIAHTMTPGSHGTTFGGSPLACAAGHYVLSTLSTQEFQAHVQEMGAYLEERLARLPQLFPTILQPTIRGRGLIRGLVFSDGSHPGKVLDLARQRGVLVLTAGSDAIRLVPSLNVVKEELDFGLDVLESCIGLLNSGL